MEHLGEVRLELSDTIEERIIRQSAVRIAISIGEDLSMAFSPPSEPQTRTYMKIISIHCEVHKMHV